MVLRGQGTQSGAIGEVKGPKVVPLGLQSARERSSGEVKDSKSGPAETHCLSELWKSSQTVANHLEPESRRRPKSI